MFPGFSLSFDRNVFIMLLCNSIAIPWLVLNMNDDF